MSSGCLLEALQDLFNLLKHVQSNWTILLPGNSTTDL